MYIHIYPYVYILDLGLWDLGCRAQGVGFRVQLLGLGPDPVSLTAHNDYPAVNDSGQYPSFMS